MILVGDGKLREDRLHAVCKSSIVTKQRMTAVHPSVHDCVSVGDYLHLIQACSSTHARRATTGLILILTSDAGLPAKLTKKHGAYACRD
jgi:hypothetical protein